MLGRKFAKAAATLLIAAGLVGPANAELILTISDGEESFTTTDFDDNGTVLFVGSVGSWVFNVTIGLADPMNGDDASTSSLDLASLNVSGRSETGGTLYISLTDTDNMVPYGDTNYYVGVGGNTDGTVTFASYVDSTNAAFGTETLLYETAVLTGSPFSASGSGGVEVEGPYSITTVATINHQHGFNVTSFAHTVEIPEPAVLALVGVGLLGMAFGIRAGRRRARRAPAVAMT